MVLTNLLLAIIFGVTTIVFVLLTGYVWRKRSSPGSFYFALLMADGAVFALINMLQMLATDMQTQVLLAKLLYVGVVPVPVLWVFFAIAYSQRTARLSKGYLVLWIVPAMVLSLVFTNEWHHLFWTNIAPMSGENESRLVFDFGVGLWLNAIYSYTLMTLGVILMVTTSMRINKRGFLQTATVIVGASIPVVGNIVYFIWLNKYAAFDPTSITLAMSGLTYAWITHRYQLFDLIPLARDRLITDMAAGIIVLDNLDRIIDINPAALRITGTKAAIGQEVAAALENRKELLECIRNLTDGSQEVHVNWQNRDLWLDVRVSPLQNNLEQVTCRLITLHDITRRKLDSMTLDETRRNFQTIFDTMGDLLFVVSDTGKILEINDAVTRRLGYARKEAIGMSILDLIPPDERQFAGKMQDKKPLVDLEMSMGTLLAKDGSRIVVETNIAGGVWDGKNSVFGISRDITERKRAEEALKESEEKFRVLAETTTGAILILQDEHFVYVNPATCKLTGYSEEVLASMKFRELIDEEYRELAVNRYMALIRGEAVPDIPEVKIVDSRNVEKWVESTVGVIEFNKRPALMITAFEITERKNAEDKLLVSLREKEVMLKEIHHRVKNNLQIIISLQNLQLSTGVNHDIVSIFKENQNRIMSMALVHENIYQSPDLSRVNFSDYVQSLTGHLQRAYFKNSGIGLRYEVDPLFTSIDRSIPCGLIINELVTNSLKYAFPDGRKGNIFVGFTRDADRYTLTVGDDGIGLPAGLDWRSSPSLGLQLVLTLVDQIDGTIELDASQGTVYRITFAEIKSHTAG